MSIMKEQNEQENNTELLLEQELNEQFMGKSDLVRSMHVVLANTFSMYLLAHKYHWNVEGPFFSSYHDFLENYMNRYLKKLTRQQNKFVHWEVMHQAHSRNLK